MGKLEDELNEKRVIKKMALSITYIIKEYIKAAPYAREFTAIILSYEGDGIYKIKHHGIEYKAVSAYQFDIGTRVRVIVPNNQFRDIYLIPYKRCKGFIE